MEKGRDGSADDRNNMRKNALFIGILFISAGGLKQLQYLMTT